MLTKRIIPCLDCDLSILTGRVVKGKKFKDIIYAGRPEILAEKYYKGMADEIVFLDITASYEKRRTMTEVIEKTSERVFVPLTVGGGIKTIEDVNRNLNVGADKVAVNTHAIKNPEFIKESSKIFGSQCIVIAIDAKKTNKTKSGYEVFIYGGRQETGIDAVEWAEQCEQLGAGEILLTSMDKDGTKEGFEINLTEKISEILNIPVIASGGVGNPNHIYEVFKKTKASAALAASIFHFDEYPIPIVKKFLRERGISVRM